MQVTVAPNSSRFCSGTARSESKGAVFAFAGLVELSPSNLSELRLSKIKIILEITYIQLYYRSEPIRARKKADGLPATAPI